MDDIIVLDRYFNLTNKYNFIGRLFIMTQYEFFW